MSRSLDELHADLLEEIARAGAKADHDARIAPNSYGAGYRLGYVDALKDALSVIKDDMRAAVHQARERDVLTSQIASILDHPSAYMGGPSIQSRKKAERIVEFLERENRLASNRGVSDDGPTS